jgi:hypothetical protein
MAIQCYVRLHVYQILPMLPLSDLTSSAPPLATMDLPFRM